MLVRQMCEDDIETVMQIEATAWGDEAATIAQVATRWQTFPLGSVVAEAPDGKLVGYAASQRVDAISTKSWDAQTDGGLIAATHRPEGQIAYGVSMSALPEGAIYGDGVGAAIIGHYHKIYIEEGRCSILALGSRLPGFARWSAKYDVDIRTYLNQERGGFSRDPELRLYQKNGFQLLWEIADYFADPESLDYGAMIVRK